MCTAHVQSEGERERVCMYDGKRDAGVGVGVGGWVLGWG